MRVIGSAITIMNHDSNNRLSIIFNKKLSKLLEIKQEDYLIPIIQKWKKHDDPLLHQHEFILKFRRRNSDVLEEILKMEDDENEII